MIQSAPGPASDPFPVPGTRRTVRRPDSRVRRATTVGLAVLAASCGPLGLAGCYRHVVRADGPAAERADVYEPNLKNERIPIVDDLEDAMFGARPRPD